MVTGNEVSISGTALAIAHDRSDVARYVFFIFVRTPIDLSLVLTSVHYMRLMNQK